MTIVSLNERELRHAIAKMFLSFPSSGRWNEKKLEAYYDALHRIPLAYVKEATEYVARGKLGPDLPSAAALTKLAGELQYRAMKKKPPAREVEAQNTHIERTRVILGFRELISDLKSGKRIEPDLATAKVFTLKEEI